MWNKNFVENISGWIFSTVFSPLQWFIESFSATEIESVVGGLGCYCT